MATVGEITILTSSSPAYRFRVEVEVTATDGDPDDPQMTEFKPLRVAYTITDDTIFDAEGKWGELVLANATGEWIDLPTPIQNTPITGYQVGWKRK